MREKDIAIARLDAAVRLDKATGRLYWKAREREQFASNAAYFKWCEYHEGKEAFVQVVKGGYKYGCVFGVRIAAHRIVFALTHGHWPKNVIDHIDRNPLNNRPENLRDVTSSYNLLRNRVPRCVKPNRHGVRGLVLTPAGKWAAYVRANGGRRKYAGTFTTKEQAIACLHEHAIKL